MKRFDCTNGRAQFCYGCYTMTEDSDGDYVRYDDHAAELDRLREAAAAALQWLETNSGPWTATTEIAALRHALSQESGK